MKCVLSTNQQESQMDKAIAIIPNRFNPSEFIGDSWKTVSIKKRTRSESLTELDLTNVHLVTMLKDSECLIIGYEKIKRLRASGYIRLDADVFFTLWENKALIPELWKEEVNGNIRHIYFDGTDIQYSVGGHYVLYLFWKGGVWNWNVNWLGHDLDASSLSAVLVA